MKVLRDEEKFPLHHMREKVRVESNCRAQGDGKISLFIICFCCKIKYELDI